MSDISEALEAFEAISSDEADNRQQWLEATRFHNGDQWPDALKKLRESDPSGARPCLVNNVLPHYTKQVTNEMRQNRPSIRVLPVDDGADVETANALQGIIRHIEARSDADVAYCTAGRHAVIGGWGYWRILSEYVDEEYGYQDLRIKRVNNPLSVYMSRSDCPAGSDATDVFVTELIPKKAYEKQYGKSAPMSMPTMGAGDDVWMDDDYIRIAEWFHVDMVAHKAVTLNDGRRIKESDLEARRKKTGETVAYNATDGKILQRQITWRKMNGGEYLKEQKLQCKYIPVVRVIGQEVDIEGKRSYFGMVRDAMDPQRMRNYWRSCETEMIALAPKAPFIGALGAFDGMEANWAAANNRNIAYLEYNAMGADGNPIPMPQRQQAAPIPSAMVQAAQNADWDIKATTGIFGAGLGEPSQEKSGRAIIERKNESDISTYDYMDNLSISIRHTGRILVDETPRVFDTARIARILGEDGKAKMVKLDPKQKEAYRESDDEKYVGIYNPSVGRYDVEVVTGPSYATKRQQAADSMDRILQGNPQLWSVAGDLLAKNLDWPGADVFAERLKKTIDPKLLEDDGEGPESNPADQQMIAQLDQTIQAMSAEMEQMQSVVQEAEQAKKSAEMDREFEKQKIEIERQKLALETYRAETERMKMIATTPNIIEILKPLGMLQDLQEEPSGNLEQWEGQSRGLSEGELVPIELLMTEQNSAPNGSLM
jgi:hypothetical protein